MQRKARRWSSDQKKRQDLENTKDSLAQTALLAHPEASAELTLFTDASDHSVRAILQQRYKDNSWEPLAFFSKKLNPEAKYSAFDQKLLTIYLAIKYLRYLIEAWRFTIYTDHKPLTYAFRQNREKCTPRQFHYLDYIGQFTTDIRYVIGQENITVNALSRVKQTPNHGLRARSQREDQELAAIQRKKPTTQANRNFRSQPIWCEQPPKHHGHFW